MASYVILKAVEAPDGVRVLFTTPSEYAPGTVRVLRGGVWQTESLDDGWVEKGVDKVQLNTPPKTGDVILFFYRRP